MYRRSRSLGDAVRASVDRWPSFDRWTSGTQLVRAVDSIGANIAEAYGRATTPDRLRLLYIARGSLLESEHWIVVARARSLSLPSDAEELLLEIARTLNGLLHSPGSRR